MMRPEGKATRNLNRSSPWKSSYVAYGLLLGSLLVLLYLMVSTQFSYSQKGIMINPPLLVIVRVKKLHELKEQEGFMINPYKLHLGAHTQPCWTQRQSIQLKQSLQSIEEAIRGKARTHAESIYT